MATPRRFDRLTETVVNQALNDRSVRPLGAWSPAGLRSRSTRESATTCPAPPTGRRISLNLPVADEIMSRHVAPFSSDVPVSGHLPLPSEAV